MKTFDTTTPTVTAARMTAALDHIELTASSVKSALSTHDQTSNPLDLIPQGDEWLASALLGLAREVIERSDAR
jgi:hypothetical protein